MKLIYLLAVLTALSALFQLPQLQPLVIWNIDQIQSGQWWRIVSGNLTHTNHAHFLMNIAALWLVAALFRPTIKSFIITTTIMSVLVGSAMMLFSFHTYAGLSGVLHGLFAFYALGEAQEGRNSSWLLVGGVCAKIAFEQLYGASENTASLIDAAVATEAHLVGGIAGVLLAIGGNWDRLSKP